MQVTVAAETVDAALARLTATLSPGWMASRFTWRLRKRLLEEAREAFGKEGEPSGSQWHPLSDMRSDNRGGVDGPILNDTGMLRTEVMGFRGKLRATDKAFSFWFPDFYEMSGPYWGLTAGQRVNPLGMTPLSHTPRRVLAAGDRLKRDALEALAEYFVSEGLMVEVSGD